MKQILSITLLCSIMLLSASLSGQTLIDYSNCKLSSKGTSIRYNNVTLASNHVQVLKQNNVDFKEAYNVSRLYKTSSTLFLLSSISFTSGYLYKKVKMDQDNKNLLVFAASTATLSLVFTLMAQAKTESAVQIHNKSIQLGINESGISLQYRL